MRFFFDLDDIQNINISDNSHLIDGICLDAVFLKKNKNSSNLIKDFSEMIEGPIIASFFEQNPDVVIKEANALRRISENICIQLPVNFDNLRLCRELVDDGFFVSMNLCFSVSQAVLSAKAGANFVAISMQKCDQAGINKLNLLSDIRKAYDNYTEFQTEILISNTEDVLTIHDAFKIGVDACCTSSKTLRALSVNTLTEQEIKNTIDQIAKININNDDLY